ncbi:hypothetical protein IJ750_03875 [bacterium]|nr:hypothetical protein [bacterium]
MKKCLIFLGLTALISSAPVFAHPCCYGNPHSFHYMPPPPPPRHHMQSPYYGGMIVGRRWNQGKHCRFNSNLGYFNGMPYRRNGGFLNTGFTIRF